MSQVRSWFRLTPLSLPLFPSAYNQSAQWRSWFKNVRSRISSLYVCFSWPWETSEWNQKYGLSWTWSPLDNTRDLPRIRDPILANAYCPTKKSRFFEANGEAPYLLFSFWLETSAGTHGLFCRRRWGNSTEMKSFSEPTHLWSSPLAYNFQNGLSILIRFIKSPQKSLTLHLSEEAAYAIRVIWRRVPYWSRVVLPVPNEKNGSTLQPQESGQKILLLVLSYSHQQRVGHNPFTKEAFGR